jgi:hypothetical protein
VQRRQVLAAAGAALPALSLSGCLGTVTGPTRLRPADVDVEDGSTDLVFRNDRGRLAALSVVHHAGYDPDANLAAVRVSVSHRQDTRVDGLTLRFGIPADGVGRFDAFLKAPGSDAFPAVRLYEQREGAVFEASDLGRAGRGTVTLDFLLRPWGGDVPLPGPLPVDVDASVSLASAGLLGQQYVATGQTTVEVAHNDWRF